MKTRQRPPGCQLHSSDDQMGVLRLGIGMDSLVAPISHGGLRLVQTTDFFSHLVDLQGEIACAKILSGLGAFGATECDNMFMIASVSSKLTDKERVVYLLVMKSTDANLRIVCGLKT